MTKKSESGSGAGTTAAIPTTLPADPAAAPTGASAPTAPDTSVSAPSLPSLTADDVRAWLALRGVAAADMEEATVQGLIESLDDCTSNRQLGKTLGWIGDKLVAVGRPAIDPTGVTIASLKAEVVAAAAAMAPPAPKPPSRGWLAVLWCLGFFSWALTKFRSAGRRAGSEMASGGRAVGRGIARRWKPILFSLVGLALLAGLVFGGLKGYQWWQTRALEAVQTPKTDPLESTVEPTPPVAVTPTPEPPHPSPTRPLVVPGPTKPAIYYPNLDMECVMYGRLQSCTLPPGCTEGFVTNPPRLQVTCPGGIVYTDNRNMIEYPANQRVSVRLHRQ